jgi:hypothetical protein
MFSEVNFWSVYFSSWSNEEFKYFLKQQNQMHLIFSSAFFIIFTQKLSLWFSKSVKNLFAEENPSGVNR